VLARFGELVREFDVELHVVEDGPRRERLAELQAEADERQMDDPAYRRELGHWIGIGALGASWLAARVGQVAITVLDLGEREGRKNSRFVERAPVVAVLTTTTDTVGARVRTGQAFERATLAATHEGLAVHPMSQVLERPASKAALADLLDLDGAVPQHLFRLGYPAEEPGEHTPRWPLSTVLRETH
jgi:nitroreductase